MTATDQLHVDPTNTASFKAWDGDEGAWWAANADHFDRSVSKYHQALLDAAAIVATDRVLDVGCGTGQTTRDAARAASSGTALGVDLSSAMLDVADQRAASDGLTNAVFLQADAQVHPFDDGSFDVAISRTGTMFFGDAVAAFTNIAHALTGGGRLAVVTWQPLSEQEWMQQCFGALAVGRNLSGPPANMPGPFAFSEPDHVRSVLTAAGFTDIELKGIAESMWFGHDSEDAQRLLLGVLGWMLADLGEADQAKGVAALRSALEAHTTEAGVEFGSAVWLTTARRA